MRSSEHLQKGILNYQRGKKGKNNLDFFLITLEEASEANLLFAHSLYSMFVAFACALDSLKPIFDF
jgi:hypothetical protein